MADNFALEWDSVGEKKFELGCDRGVLYLQDDNGAYSSGEVWNGLINITESPSGAEPTDLYADNIKYGSMRSAETFGATIEAYTYPDSFERCDGTATIAPGVTIGQQSRIPFGLAYRTKMGNDTASEADDGYKIHLVYGCTASPSEKGYGTINDSPEAITFSWELSTVATPVPGFEPTATIVINSLKTSKEKLEKLEHILYGTGGPSTGTKNVYYAGLPMNGASTQADEGEEEGDGVVDGTEDGDDTVTTTPAATMPRLPLPAEIIEIMGEDAEVVE